eukprot:sb/3465397/
MEGKRSQPYGTECDWWSLGVVIYELLYGETPFTDDTMVLIYSHIMNFERKLEFPQDDDWKLSDEGVSLIKGLIAKKRERLDFEGIKAHSYFKKVKWDSLLNQLPPFVPELASIDDTSHFDYEDLAPSQNRNLRNARVGGRGTGFTGQDVPFCGFTFSKNLVEAAQVGVSISSAGGNTSELESQLKQKTRELKEHQEKVHSLQSENTEKKQAVQELSNVLKEKVSAYDTIALTSFFSKTARTKSILSTSSGPALRAGPDTESDFLYPRTPPPLALTSFLRIEYQNRNLRNARVGGRGTGFTGQDVPFCGFTFSKNLVEAAQVGISISSAGGNTSELESQLKQKTRELKEHQEKMKDGEVHVSDVSENTEKKQAVQELSNVLKEKVSAYDTIAVRIDNT